MSKVLRILAPIGLVLILFGCGSEAGLGGSSSDVWEVTDLLAAEEPGDVRVVGSLFDDGDGLLLCEFLAESFPPQCTGPSIRIINPGAIDAVFTTTATVRWTDHAVTLSGEMIDGELRVES